MAQAQILVVEDENLIAKDIQNRLKSLGYAVPALASSGEEALRKAAEVRPDLVLMDIVLKGDMDGVETAERLRERFDIPVIYLTAYADDHTLQRAKITEPFGYILKPFEERELHTTIETALYKHQCERKLRENFNWFAMTLKCIGDGVIVTDERGQVTFMNAIAETLTGWKLSEAHGKELGGLIAMQDEARRAMELPAAKALREGVSMNLAGQKIVLVGKDRSETPIDVSVAPVRDDEGNVSGSVLVFREAGGRRDGDGLVDAGVVRQLKREIDELLKQLGRAPKYSVPA